MSHDNNDHQTFNHGAPAGHAEGIHQTPASQVHGNVTRVQLGADTGPREVMQAPEFEAAKVRGSVTRYVVGQDEAQSGGPARYVHNGADTTGTNRGSIALTLTSTFGRPSVELIPGDPSSRTLVETAEREGLIRRDAFGQWVDVAVASTATPADQPQQAQEQPQTQRSDEGASGTPLAPDVVEDILHDAGVLGLQQSQVDALQARAIHAAVGDGDFAAIGTQLASEVPGLEPEQATDWVTGLVERYQDAADAAMGRLGLVGDDLAAFYDSLKADPRMRTHIAQRFALAGDATPLRSAAMAWIGRNQRKGR